MSSCKNCGSNVGAETVACVACGQSFVSAVVLEGASGSISAALNVQVGRRLLERAVGDEARYAADVQFCLERNARGAWSLMPMAGVPNPTFVNGVAAPSTGLDLNEGDEVSIAGKAGRLKVRFLREV